MGSFWVLVVRVAVSLAVVSGVGLSVAVILWILSSFLLISLLPVWVRLLLISFMLCLVPLVCVRALDRLNGCLLVLSNRFMGWVRGRVRLDCRLRIRGLMWSLVCVLIRMCRLVTVGLMEILVILIRLWLVLWCLVLWLDCVVRLCPVHCGRRIVMLWSLLVILR